MFLQDKNQRDGAFVLITHFSGSKCARNNLVEQKDLYIDPVVNACTTMPVAGSTSAAASRTATPVIFLISFLSEWTALKNNCRWNAAPEPRLADSSGQRMFGLRQGPCSVITSMSSLRTTVADLGAWPVRNFWK